MHELSIEAADILVGVDCEDVERWRRILPELERGAQRRLFTDAEHAYCRSLPDPAPHYAARWCAKEAVAKAMSPYLSVDLRDIEVFNAPDGAPHIRFTADNAQALDSTVRLSMAHTENTAVAMVLVIVNRAASS